MEFYWGLSRGDIEQESHLNRVRCKLFVLLCKFRPLRDFPLVRADMKQLLENEEWTLTPTDETLHRIYDLQDYNQECCPDDRRTFTNVRPYTSSDSLLPS